MASNVRTKKYFEFNKQVAVLTVDPGLYKGSIATIVGAKSKSSVENRLLGDNAKRALIKLVIVGTKKNPKTRQPSRKTIYCAPGKVDDALYALIGKAVTGLGKIDHVYRPLRRAYQ